MTDPTSRTDGDRFRRLTDLFEQVVTLDPAEREAEIDRLCGDDAELATELRELLRADETEGDGDYLGEVIAAEAEAIGPRDATGQVLGPWRIVEPLAEGGMGTVYRAERADGSYEATAAIKLVRGGIPSPQLDERLREERQILAGLSHPGIAQLLDGGTTPDGTPYLVLEYIDGQPITTWCDEEGVGVDDRIRLFLKVCESVAYAHGQLVAHRDLKPSNILVTADGEPKLLDFGIAKLVDAVDEASDGATRSASLMTPSYASPEQVSGRRAGVSSDVYALGVLLYELLTGRLPLTTRGLTPVALQKVVLVDVPPLPSSVAPTPALQRRLSGDLDAVLSHALRKEPEERYPSVLALAEDLDRHLSGLPVRVRRDDWAYRTGKLVRRNAGAVAGMLVLLITLVSFTASTLLQARALARERDRAEEQRETAQRVSGFLEELLTEADPNENDGREVTAREVLDRGAARILDDLQGDPEIQAALATVMGRVYRGLGEYGAAEPLLDSGLVVRRRLDAEPLTLSESLLERAALHYDNGQYEAMLPLTEEALTLLEATFSGDHIEKANAIDWHGLSLEALGRDEEALPYAREYVAMSRRLHDEPNADLAVAVIGLADKLRGRGEYDEAEALGREGLEIMRAVHEGDDLDLAWALNQLASTLYRAGEGEEAVGLAREGLEMRKRVHGVPHVETVASLGNLANVLTSLGRVDEAEEARRESVEMVREIFPPEHPYVAASLSSLGQLLTRSGKLDEAIPLLQESVDLHRIAFRAGHPNIAIPLTGLGIALLEAGDPAAAEPVLREAYDIRREGLGEGRWEIGTSALHLGRTVDLLGRAEEAEVLLRTSREILEASMGADHERAVEARRVLAAHYEARGLTERAAEVEGANPGR